MRVCPFTWIAPSPMAVKLLDPSAKAPVKAYEDDLGFDFHALETVVVRPGEVARVRTGVALKLPYGYGMVCHLRSGLAKRHGAVLATSGVIDGGYRGEIVAHLATTMPRHFTITAGERFLQGILTPIVPAYVCVVDHLNPSDRGEGGWGSTGR